MQALVYSITIIWWYWDAGLVGTRTEGFQYQNGQLVYRTGVLKLNLTGFVQD